MYAFVPLNTAQSQQYTIVKPVFVDQLLSPEHQSSQETTLKPFTCVNNYDILKDGVTLANSIITPKKGAISLDKKGAKTNKERLNSPLAPSCDYNDTNAIDDSDVSEEDDIHICGKCRQEFFKYDLFIHHKRTCSLRKTPKSLRKQHTPDNQAPPSNSSPPSKTVPLTYDYDKGSHFIPDCFSPDDIQPIKPINSDGDILNRNSFQELRTVVCVNDQSDPINNGYNSDNDDAISIDSSTINKEKDQSLPIATTNVDNIYEDTGDDSRNLVPKKKDNSYSAEVENHKVFEKTKVCSFEGCSYRARFNKDIARHYTTHSGAKPWSCDTCDKSFARKDKLTRHMSIHSGEKKYVCMYCPYKTYEKSHLIKHLRVHTDERPYFCQVCNYRSKSSSQIRVHLRTHTGESPFKCDTNGCESAFKTRSDLTRHQKIHAEEKPYKCDICGHEVSFKGNLRKHMLKVHNVA